MRLTVPLLLAVALSGCTADDGPSVRAGVPHTKAPEAGSAGAASAAAAKAANPPDATASATTDFRVLGNARSIPKGDPCPQPTSATQAPAPSDPVLGVVRLLTPAGREVDEQRTQSNGDFRLTAPSSGSYVVVLALAGMEYEQRVQVTAADNSPPFPSVRFLLCDGKSLTAEK